MFLCKVYFGLKPVKLFSVNPHLKVGVINVQWSLGFSHDEY